MRAPVIRVEPVRARPAPPNSQQKLPDPEPASPPLAQVASARMTPMHGDSSSLRRETILQHLGEEEKYHGAVAPPLVMTSTFVFDSSDEMKRCFGPGGPDRFVYSRMGNPTLEQAEKKIAAMEQTEAARLFSSGMAAISAGIMSCVHAGAHVVAVDTVYGPTKTFLLDYLRRFGVETTLVSGLNSEEFVEASRPNTTLWFVESPSSIVFRLQDLEEVARLAKERGISTMIDNSYASPWYQQPTVHGIDLVAHSASKYLGGHSDLIAGCLACSQERMTKINFDEVAHLGGILHPFGAWQILRALRTLPIKLKAVAEAADHVSAWLKGQSWSGEVIHVGDPDFAQAELRDKQMSGWTGLFSFIPEDQSPESISVFVENLRLFRLGVSWGGHESLVVALPIQAMGWEGKKWVIRLYCGLEHPEDLCDDLMGAARACGWVKEPAQSSR
jgi:cystathionine beta-lyase/cystathionine gamma-synthase